MTSSTGDAERFLLLRKEALEAALSRLLVKKKVKTVEELIALDQTPGWCSRSLLSCSSVIELLEWNKLVKCCNCLVVNAS